MVRWWLLFLVGTLGSCQWLKNAEPDQGDLAAKAGLATLSKSEVVAMIPEGLSGEDSATFYTSYVQSWVRKQAVLIKAEYNLGEDKKNFEDQIRQYREDLLRFTYQEEMVSKYLDTVVTEAEILAYYKEYPGSFQLKENIVRANYMVLPVGAPNLAEGKKLFFSSSDREDLLAYALRYAWRFSLEDTVWISFQDLKTFIPVQSYNDPQFLQNNRRIEMADSNKVYLCNLLEYKIKDAEPPFSYVKKTIKSVILNRRKLELWADLEADIQREAERKGTIEIYD